MRSQFFNEKKVNFDYILNGTLNYMLRPFTNYWIERLQGVHIDRLVIKNGFKSKKNITLVYSMKSSYVITIQGRRYFKIELGELLAESKKHNQISYGGLSYGKIWRGKVW